MLKKKIIVVGPSCVGKTHLIYKLVNFKVPKVLPITLCIDYIINKDVIFIDYTGNKKIFSCFFNQIMETDLLIVVLNDKLMYPIEEFNYYQLYNLYRFPIIVVFNNYDSYSENIPNHLKEYLQGINITCFSVNCNTGNGIYRLKEWLTTKLGELSLLKNINL